MIREAQAQDAEAIAAIYNHYVCNTTVSFELEPVGAAEIARRVEAVRSIGLPWLVIEQDGKLAGYAYATRWRERLAYRSSVECSVYLDAAAHGRGLASALYEELLRRLAALGVHAAIGGIAQPNPASVRLHEKFGFEQVAMFREVGRKFDRWVDVGYWQRLL
ncbi:GNAT family N-acetyltransferase [Massilia terrae]|uniref:GNAT family N-acetyltransferase n=1 Tax=Massilia terrae TaxID=1811224 RepID=A0ABT2D001_9BURK|nr:GNAT family N-acetyltransferase [Massilia terrae]